MDRSRLGGPLGNWRKYLLMQTIRFNGVTIKLRRHRQPERTIQAFTLLDPLVFVILLSIVVTGTATLIVMVSHTSADSRREVAMNQAIDSNIADINSLSRTLTCCAGYPPVGGGSICTVTPPPAGTFGANFNCATNNPLDPHYFYPQRDDPATTTSIIGTNPATTDERVAVDQLCANGAFLSPLLTAINALPVPLNMVRNTTVQANNSLMVVFTDTINNRDARVVSVTPPMSRWCP